MDLLVAGNHDVGVDDGRTPVPVVDACRLSHDGRTFYCTHDPADVPEEWDGWVIHGHHHNRDLDEYPFFDARRRRINVGVDVTEFAPTRSRR